MLDRPLLSWMGAVANSHHVPFGWLMNPRSGIELLERSVDLLRRSGIPGIALYCAGALPWACALLFYFADMAYNSRPGQHLPEYSLLLTLLFLWKNIWQAVFANKLYDSLTGEARPWFRWRIIRMILVTIAIQPLALVAIPLAMVATLPYPQVLGFFKNLQVFSASDVPQPASHSWRLSLEGSRQSWIALSIISLAALVTFLNCAVFFAMLPQFLKMFFGIETELSRLGSRIVSPVLLVSVSLIVYLVFDPLLDAFFTLRCFYSQTVATGEDLRIDFRRAAAILLILAVTATALPAQTPTLVTNKLDTTIGKVLERDEFLWREPKEGKPPAWLEGISRAWSRAVDWVSALLKKLFDKDSDKSPPALGSDPNRRTLELLLYISAAVFLAALGAMFYWQRTRIHKPKVAATVSSEAVKIDLKDETVTADQLPEEAWLALAQGEAAKGEFRLATRALYLAGLNHLMHRELVSIKKWKSGQEYLGELERRARKYPQVPPVFAQSLQLFEKGWYGKHCVDGLTYTHLLGQIEEIRRSANA